MINKFIVIILLSVFSSVGFATTADDQGRTARDTELTRSIREKIVADQSLSMRAKNITIISKGGQVTLKGAVASSKEQTRVEEIAKKASGTKGVINQTEVSTSY